VGGGGGERERESARTMGYPYKASLSG
jgi:hypothetical protein